MIYNLSDAQMHQIETPCIVMDIAKVKRNICEMQALVNAKGCRLRPHVKTHKMLRLAQMQVEAGCAGITCAKISEAEVMASGGMDDIFIAYPMVGAHRIARAIALSKRIRRLILSVDSIECAKALSDAAQKAALDLEIRMEVDTGGHRTGVPYEKIVDTAKEIASMPGLFLNGIFTFKSNRYHGRTTLDLPLAAKEEADLLTKAAERIRAAGIPIQDVSGGGTATGGLVAGEGAVNEVRPGTYVFYDYIDMFRGVNDFDHIATHYYSTVVSAQMREYAVIDGGCKTFGTDTPLQEAPYNFKGYAVVDGRDDLWLSRVAEEHGFLESAQGSTGLYVGQILQLTPLHICPCINLMDSIYCLEENGSLSQQKVDARGCIV